MTADDLIKASVTIGPRLSVTLSVLERDAVSLVSREVFDGRGVATGLKAKEDFALQVADMNGKTCFEVAAKCNERQQTVRSAIVEPEHRAGAMAEMFAYLGSDLFTEFFTEK